MPTALLIFPHQLFNNHPASDEAQIDRMVMIEEPLFFGDPQYPSKFHKQKLAFHRSTMKRHAARLKAQDFRVDYIEYQHDTGLLSKTMADLMADGIDTVYAADLHDFILEKRLTRSIEATGLELRFVDSPGFLNTPQLNREYRDGKKRWFMADYYKFQRKRLRILVDEDNEPEGGQWSFDDENRKKVPKNRLADIPVIAPRKPDEIDEAACEWVETSFPDNPGNLNSLWYPVTHEQARDWLERFLTQRFHNFGDYEDAIEEGESWLWHSVLTPMLNTGLLTPRQVVNTALDYAEANSVPINSLEGFIRQVIGWREFMAGTYDDLGVKMRTTNHWNHTRRLPDSLYTGTTGLLPIDDCIARINDTAYAHHIERLMVLGGFMFLCEIDPDDIYRWYMEMFIDAYDWVMVPNAYAMSQNADGGLITTKPYFSGSNYIRKMSHYPTGEWADIWDGLYWRWIWINKDKLEKNPRWAMMCATARRMDEKKMKAHLTLANDFLDKFNGERSP